jgi:hypothetical protein
MRHVQIGSVAMLTDKNVVTSCITLNKMVRRPTKNPLVETAEDE